MEKEYVYAIIISILIGFLCVVLVYLADKSSGKDPVLLPSLIGYSGMSGVLSFFTNLYLGGLVLSLFIANARGSTAVGMAYWGSIAGFIFGLIAGTIRWRSARKPNIKT